MSVNTDIVNVDANVEKAKSPITKVVKTGVSGFKEVSKTSKLGKKIVKVLDKLSELPAIIDHILLGMKSFKIIKGALAVPKLYKKSLKIVKPESPYDKFLTIYGVVKCVKKVVGAVATALGYLKKLHVVTKAALAWTAITDIIFLPLTFIKVGTSAVTLAEKVTYLKDFKSKTDFEGLSGSGRSTVDVITEVCQNIISEEKKLRKMKVITKACPLKKRLKNVIGNLQNANEAISKKAADEGLFIAMRLKDRIREHVGMQAVKTSLNLGKAAMVVLSLTIPIAAVPYAIVGLAFAAIKFASYIYAKFIPNGDILPTEKKMFFARIADGIEQIQHAVSKAIRRQPALAAAAA